MVMYMITIEDLYFIGCDKKIFQNIINKCVDQFVLNYESV